VTRRQVVAYGAHRDQHCDLFLPDGDGPFPVAVVIHGGFWRARYGRQLMDAVCTDLGSRGVAAWNVEYRRLGLRSRGGWPETFLDVAAAVDAVVTLDPAIDLSRVVTVGHSAGGQLALWAAARDGLPAGAPGAGPAVRVAYAVAQAGVPDLAEACRLRLSRGVVERLLGGPPERRGDVYALASPAERLPIGVPQLLVHGAADDTVPAQMSRDYHARALAAGDEALLAVLPGVGHYEHLDPTSRAWSAVTGWLGRVL
jgi:acetyl esterase/lipase